MGGMLSCLATRAACCCTSAACHCCSQAITPALSGVTRIAYALLLMVVSILAWTTETGWIESMLNKVPGGFVCPPGRCTGPMAVLRIMSALVLFHLTLSVLLIGVHSSRDKRAGIQNGFWGPKLFVWVVLTVLAFLIPNEFYHVYGIISFGGAVIFILIQLILLIDFAAVWNESWVSAYEEHGDRKWVFLLIATVLLFYSTTLVVSILLYVYFCSTGGCGLNTFFVTFNLVLSIVASALSISPRVQEARPSSGLLQASIVVLYNIYVVASAMSDEVNEPGVFECNTIANSTTQTATVVVGAVLTFISIAYSTSQAATRGKLLMASPTSTASVAPAAGSATSAEDLALVLDAQPVAAIPMTATAAPAPAAPAPAPVAPPAPTGAPAIPAPLASIATTAEAATPPATAAAAATAPPPQKYDDLPIVPPPTKESRRRALQQAVEEGALPQSALTQFNDEDADETAPFLGRVKDDEVDSTNYVYSAFHLIFALAAMYMSMLMTGWNTADPTSGELVNVGHDWTTVWVRPACRAWAGVSSPQIVSSWVAFALYTWTLVAPLVFPDREWA